MRLDGNADGSAGGDYVRFFQLSSNQLPAIESFSASPDPVVSPGEITLTASGVADPDGEVVRVEFYRDTNGDGIWGPGDQLLGYTIEGSGGEWSLSGVSTAGWDLGNHTLFARALDNEDAWSEAAVTTVVVDQIATTRIDMTIVHQPSAVGGNGQVEELPASEQWVHEWQSLWVEIWVSTPDTTTLGVARATVDLAYDLGYLTAQEIVHGPAFEEDLTGAIHEATGLVSMIGGRTELTNVGAQGYVLLARVRFASTEDDQVPIDLATQKIGPYDMGMTFTGGQTALLGVGAVEPELGSSPETELWAVVYDIDDNNQIDFGDFSFFAAAFGQTVGKPTSEPPYVWWADFDKSGRVDFGDLAFFAPNFGKTRAAVQAGEQTLVFLSNFPDAWRPVPAVPDAEGEAMSGDAGHQPSSAAVFAELGIAEVEGAPPWLRPSPATAGHGSRLINTSQQPEFPATPQSLSDSSVVGPAERATRWSEHWEPLEDLLSLLADQSSDLLPNPHDAVFAQVSQRGAG